MYSSEKEIVFLSFQFFLKCNQNNYWIEPNNFLSFATFTTTYFLQLRHSQTVIRGSYDQRVIIGVTTTNVIFFLHFSLSWK